MVMDANAFEGKAKNTKVESRSRNGSSSVQFTWEIYNFSKLRVKRLYSHIFNVGDFKWRILVFPEGNNVDYLSVYLDVADPVTVPHECCRNALFSLSVINQIHSEHTITKAIEHEFKAGEKDCGFTSFVPLIDLYDSSKGYLVNDICIVKAEVTLKKKQDVKKKQEPTHVDLQPAEALPEPTLVGMQPAEAQVEAKIASIPLAPFIVGQRTVQLPQPTEAEAEIRPSYLSQLDVLFGDIETLIGRKNSNSKTLSSFFLCRACSEEEIYAHNIFKECLNMKLASVIEEGREIELKKSLSIMITGNECPDNMVSFTTKFIENLDQYIGAQKDLREVQDKEKSIEKLETIAKQLASEFMPLRNQAEAVDQEIFDLERQLREKKVKKVCLRKSIEDLADRATASKQGLIDAHEVMSLLRIKKKIAEKMISEMECSWEFLKSTIP
ncbi:MATH domain and coiled-coil domain-containing protein At3g58380-like isoform X2 [Cannabis sativa]|uniref:MATH domain and coiled-coil domain-containing protein At3g58380-like isoform X2 n=1 Tax=Cannabis sativa TaxID=3483 RepID=UPI0029CA7964|nr:MATH domain and coiled-coil domain-containing protein At3g58380-like isoform X2 [Cannabis sativa]